MPQFYKVDHRKITFREYWNLSPNWKGVVAWLLKILGRPISEPNVYTQPLSCKEFEVLEDQLPVEHASAMSEARKQLEALGFHSATWTHLPPLHGNVSLAAGTLLHDSGKSVARIIHSKATSGTITMEQLVTAFLSPLNDGRVLVTTDMREVFRGAPPNFVVDRRVGASLSSLHEAHVKRLAEVPAANIQLIQTTAQCDAFIDDFERQTMDFNLRRGLYVIVSPEELARKEVETAAAQRAVAEGQKYPKVLAEIERIRTRKASWTSTLWILGISILLFVALGAFRWSWQIVAILVGVLFFHELGHYVAMRAFNYQNLRMFFIPLLGAAVSGRNYNVKGWQKAIVSLAGPLPGIIVGGALGLFAIVAEHALASRIALMALLLNGINLLPVLPLDGGWLMHTLVFCRRYWLEGAFHVLAGLIMVGYRIAGGEQFWLFLGIFMLFTSPAAFRMARLAHRLKARGLSAVSHDQQTIPRETAETIIDEVKASLPGAHSDKTLATLTLSTFEKLNATPPSLASSALLFIVYVGSLVFALVFAGVLMVARPRMSLSAESLQPVVPKLEYACNTTRQIGQISLAPASILISSYDDRAEAEKALTDILYPTNEMRTLFGQTIFRAVREPEPSRFGNADVVERPLSNQFVTAFVSCVAADETAASALTNELQAYFEVAQIF
jgi:Zn-dependent protease